MAWTPPATFTAGVQALASWMNTYVRDNLTALWAGTTPGDMDYYSSSTTKNRFAMGTAGQVVRANSAASAPEFGDNAWELSLPLGNAVDLVTTGIKYDIEIPQAVTIDRVTLTSRETGSIVVDLWVDTYANFPPIVADTICASAKPTISGASKYQDATLTGWSKNIAAGSFLTVNVTSVATFTQCWVHIKGRKI